tara:strand:+ start:6733 stop:8286 length:1554 start_codon:yes stop_codon:yes gene_type:complete
LDNIKKLASQTAIYGISSVIGRILNYLLVPLYTRLFTTSEYGVVTEMYAYVAFLVVFLTYGMETAFFRFSKKENEKQVYSTALLSLIFSSSIFVFIITLNSSLIAEYMGYGVLKEYIDYFAIIVALDAISAIVFAKLRQQERAARFVFVKLLGILSNISLNIYFIWFKGMGIEYIFISNLISSVFVIVFLFSEITKVKLDFKLDVWKKMLYYGLPLLVAGLAGISNETLDRVLIKQTSHPKHIYENYINQTDFKNNAKISNHEAVDILNEINNHGDNHEKLSKQTKSFINKVRTSELGLYGAFYKLSILMILFIQGFRFAAEPFFFSHNSKNGDKKVYADIMKYFIICMAFIFLVIIIFYDFFVSFLGSDFRQDDRGFMVLSILLLSNFLLGVFFNLSIWYKLTDKTAYGAYLSIGGAIITISFNLLLIPRMGFIGSAWTTLLCYFCMALASYFLAKKHFYVPYDKNRILLYVAIMLIIYILILTLNLNLIINSLFLLVFVIFVYILEKPKKKHCEH